MNWSCGNHVVILHSKVRRLLLVVTVATIMVILLLHEKEQLSQPDGLLGIVPSLESLEEENKLLGVNQYLVYTDLCKIKYDPFVPKVMKLLPPERTKLCPEELPITAISGTALHFYPDSIPENLKKGSRCCFQTIVRTTFDATNQTQDDTFSTSSDCIEITHETTEILDEIILVKCLSKNESFYRNLHYVFQKKGSRRPSRPTALKYPNPEDDPRETTTHEKLNVLIFGTDSVSRAAFLRSMPKTYRYLKENLSAIDLMAFNKVGENTFPNLMPVLSGMSEKELLSHSCRPVEKHKFDDCPFVWKKFQARGYSTAYFEDDAYYGLFTYHGRPGFLHEPTEYYGRPFFLASIKLGQITPKCYYEKTALEVLHDMSLEFVKVYENSSYFGLFWTSAITHSEMDYYELCDLPHLNYLTNLQESGVLNRTVLFFMSDHGIRFGDFRATLLGMVEENLPFAFVVLPPWFRERHPLAYGNVEANGRQLVSNYDFHPTLEDIADGSYGDVPHVTAVRSPGRGISLFQKIPARSCEQAGIPDYYCACSLDDSLASDSTGNERMNDVLAAIKAKLNAELDKYPQCSQFAKIKLLQFWDVHSHSGNPAFSRLVVHSLLSPGNVRVENVVELSSNNAKVSEELSRINEYRNDSYCVSDARISTFCYCKSWLQNKS